MSKRREPKEKKEIKEREEGIKDGEEEKEKHSLCVCLSLLPCVLSAAGVVFAPKNCNSSLSCCLPLSGLLLDNALEVEGEEEPEEKRTDSQR